MTALIEFDESLSFVHVQFEKGSYLFLLILVLGGRIVGVQVGRVWNNYMVIQTKLSFSQIFILKCLYDQLRLELASHTHTHARTHAHTHTHTVCNTKSIVSIDHENQSWKTSKNETVSVGYTAVSLYTLGHLMVVRYSWQLKTQSPKSWPNFRFLGCGGAVGGVGSVWE